MKPAKKEEYTQCNLCGTAYTTMLRVSLQCGAIYLCAGCNRALREALDNFHTRIVLGVEP